MLLVLMIASCSALLTSVLDRFEESIAVVMTCALPRPKTVMHMYNYVCIYIYISRTLAKSVAVLQLYHTIAAFYGGAWGQHRSYAAQDLAAEALAALELTKNLGASQKFREILRVSEK